MDVVEKCMDAVALLQVVYLGAGRADSWGGMPEAQWGKQGPPDPQGWDRPIICLAHVSDDLQVRLAGGGGAVGGAGKPTGQASVLSCSSAPGCALTSQMPGPLPHVSF